MKKKWKRLKVYKKALELLPDKVLLGHGLCAALFSAQKVLFAKFDFEIEDYPEVFNQKPERTAGRYWFHGFELKARKKILKKAIKELS